MNDKIIKIIEENLTASEAGIVKKIIEENEKNLSENQSLKEDIEELQNLVKRYEEELIKHNDFQNELNAFEEAQEEFEQTKIRAEITALEEKLKFEQEKSQYLMDINDKILKNSQIRKDIVKQIHIPRTQDNNGYSYGGYKETMNDSETITEQ